MHKKSVVLLSKYLFLSLAALISVFPFVWMIIGATNTSNDILRNKITFGSALSDNINKLFQTNIGFIAGFKNSVTISVVTTLISLLVCSLAGYGFEIYQSKARDKVFNILLLTMMVPFSAIMIPLYRMFASFSNIPGLKLFSLNTMGAMILPTVATAFLVFFFRQNTKGFSREIIEAARIDGLGECGIFFKMYLPIMKATFAAGAIITYMGTWNNYLWPLLVVQSPEKRTIPIALSAMGASYTTDYGALMTGIVIATLPTALIYFLMQKEFVDGMTGAVK